MKKGWVDYLVSLFRERGWSAYCWRALGKYKMCAAKMDGASDYTLKLSFADKEEAIGLIRGVGEPFISNGVIMDNLKAIACKLSNDDIREEPSNEKEGMPEWVDRMREEAERKGWKLDYADKGIRLSTETARGYKLSFDLLADDMTTFIDCLDDAYNHYDPGAWAYKRLDNRGRGKDGEEMGCVLVEYDVMTDAIWELFTGMQAVKDAIDDKESARWPEWWKEAGKAARDAGWVPGFTIDDGFMCFTYDTCDDDGRKERIVTRPEDKGKLMEALGEYRDEYDIDVETARWLNRKGKRMPFTEDDQKAALRQSEVICEKLERLIDSLN